jgi:hypothetical protein
VHAWARPAAGCQLPPPAPPPPTHNHAPLQGAPHPPPPPPPPVWRWHSPRPWSHAGHPPARAPAPPVGRGTGVQVVCGSGVRGVTGAGCWRLCTAGQACPAYMAHCRLRAVKLPVAAHAQRGAPLATQVEYASTLTAAVDGPEVSTAFIHATASSWQLHAITFRSLGCVRAAAGAGG